MSSTIKIGLVGIIFVLGGVAIYKNSDRIPVLNKFSSRNITVAPEDPAIGTEQEATTEDEEIVLTAPEINENPLPLLEVNDGLFPEADCISRLFTLGKDKLPIVETVAYTSHVSWLQGKQAWVSDYASYYSTSRHFIARSLNKKPDYFSQKVGVGSKFNVFKKSKPLEFHLLVDMSRRKMGFYYLDKETNERVLLKTYNVALGRLDAQRASGSLTPLGNFVLGDKVAIYKEGTKGFFQDKEVEMVAVFGTRWMPLIPIGERGAEIGSGYGIHGVPYLIDKATNTYQEEGNNLGKFVSDGCIRLQKTDVEEIFSIVITKPTYVHVVKDFRDISLPGVEANQ